MGDVDGIHLPYPSQPGDMSSRVKSAPRMHEEFKLSMAYLGDLVGHLLILILLITAGGSTKLSPKDT